MMHSVAAHLLRASSVHRAHERVSFDSGSLGSLRHEIHCPGRHRRWRRRRGRHSLRPRQAGLRRRRAVRAARAHLRLDVARRGARAEIHPRSVPRPDRVEVDRDLRIARGGDGTGGGVAPLRQPPHRLDRGSGGRVREVHGPLRRARAAGGVDHTGAGHRALAAHRAEGPHPGRGVEPRRRPCRAGRRHHVARRRGARPRRRDLPRNEGHRARADRERRVGGDDLEGRDPLRAHRARERNVRTRDLVGAARPRHSRRADRPSVHGLGSDPGAGRAQAARAPGAADPQGGHDQRLCPRRARRAAVRAVRGW